MRIGEVPIEAAQYVARGTLLFTGNDVAAAEVAAEFPIGRLRALVGDGTGCLDLEATEHTPGERPLLRRNVVVEVEVRAAPRAIAGVVPAAALHQGRLYVVDHEGRPPGTAVIVSDVMPAVEGMRVAPVEDRALMERLEPVARGLKADGDA